MVFCMLRTLFSVPHQVDIAFSGGVDSLVIAHFLKNGKRDVRLWHFHHGCEYSDEIMKQCQARADQMNIPMHVGYCTVEQPQGRSKEDFWREERYKFLRQSDRYMITGHHLDDAVETWVWSSLHGEGKLIPPQNQTIIRPFLLTSKQSFAEYANHHQLMAVDDPYNNDLRFMRNYMRECLLPHAYKINPGLSKVVKKKYLQTDVVLEPVNKMRMT